MVAHVLEYVLINIPIHDLHAVDAAMVLLNKVFQSQRVRTVLEEAHVLCIFNLLLGEVGLEVLEVPLLHRANEDIEAHVVLLVKAVKHFETPHRMIVETHNRCIDIDEEAPLRVFADQVLKKVRAQILPILLLIRLHLLFQMAVDDPVNKIVLGHIIVVIFHIPHDPCGGQSDYCDYEY